MTLILTFDGGAAPNPGRGYGSYLVESLDGSIRMERSRLPFGERLTNNQAEYHAMLSAINGALIALKNTPGTKVEEAVLELRTDSQLIVRQMQGRYRVKVAHLKELQVEAKAKLKCVKAWRIKWHGRKNSVALFGH